MGYFRRHYRGFKAPDLFLLVWLLATPLSAAAVVDQMQCERLALGDGLSQTSITTAYQDEQGFLWFGTQSGLNRYDGYSFRVYNREFGDLASIPDNYIVDLLPAGDGRMWVATQSGGLALYNARSDRFATFRHDPAKSDSLSHDRLSALAPADNGRVWVGTWGGGLNLFNPATGTAEHWAMRGPESVSAIRDLIVDRDGLLWLGTTLGLFTFELQTGFFSHQRLLEDSPRQPVITASAQTPDGNLWFGTEASGLFRRDTDGVVTHFQHEDFDPTTLAFDQIGTLFVDSSGSLWVGTTAGLSVFDKQSNQFTSFYYDPLDPGSLPANRISSMLEDRSGLLWFGTWTGGLCKLNTSVTSFKVYRREQDNPRSMADNRVRDFLETADGNVWIAMLGGGIARFDPVNETFQSFRNDPFYPNSIGSDDVHALAGDAEGYIWVGSRNAGLDRFDPRTGTAIRFGGDGSESGLLASDHVLDLLVDDQQRLWIGTWDSGLARMDIATGQLREYHYDPRDPHALSSDSVGVLYQTLSGEIWVGTRGDGLLRYRPESDDFLRYPQDNQHSGGLVNGVITFITEDAGGDLWIATQGGGFARVLRDPTDTDELQFQSFTHNEGLAVDAVGAALFDSAGRLWLSTLAGVSRFDPSNGQIANFYPIHGVQRASYYVGAGLSTSTGEIYFGGIDGFTRFVPLEFPIDTTPPQVVITDLLISNHLALPSWRNPDSPLHMTAGYTDTLVLTHEQDNFSFEFAGLHFAEPAKNRYQYMLQGLDSDWVETGASRRHATYTHLDSGNYLFRVRASNRDGVYSSEEAQIVVSILPPPWRTWWAYLGYVLSVGLVLGSLGLLRFRAVRTDRQAQAAIRESEQQLKLALWGSGDEFWILDTRTKEFKRMSHEGGTSRRERLNINTVEEFWAVLHPDDLEHVREKFNEHLIGETPYFEAMYRVRGEDDEWIWALSKGRAKDYDAQGLPVTVAGATKDITLLKQTEEVLRGLNEELEFRVEERTDDLQSANESLKHTLQELRATQDQLVEAEKMASLGGLVAGVAHEINTPLGVAVTASSHLEKEVRKMVNLLDEENLDREGAIAHCVQQLQNTQFVLKNLRRAAELVRSFKQVAVDQSTEDQRQFNLNDYLREVLISLRPRFKHTEHVVNVDCPEHLVLNSFPGAIYQTVTNLVMNSLVHGFEEVKEGHINIEVREHHDQAIIQYRDNGCGFDADIESRIFEPFFTTRRGRGGSGLGMHIVFNLVTQVLGGTIVCKGKPGEGVEVTINLPMQVS